MLATIFTDLHLHNYKQFDHSGSRLAYGIDCLKYMFEFSDANGINIILFGGDLFDNAGLLPTRVVNEAAKTFQDMFRKYPDIQFVSITGNHDLATKNLPNAPGVTALTHLDKLFPNFRIVDNSSVIFPSENVQVHGVPYYEYPEHFAQMVQARAKEASQHPGDKHILLIHQTPSGLGNPNIPVDTDVTDPIYDVFDHVYCGHIHVECRDITDKFTLIGTPMHRDLSDEGHTKGFLVTNLAKPEKGYKFISTKGMYPEFKRQQVGPGEQIVHKHGEDYVVPDIVMEAIEIGEGDVSEEDFGTSLKAEELMTNFYEKVHGKDEKLLATGLGFL